jgi:hypothetical protein
MEDEGWRMEKYHSMAKLVHSPGSPPLIVLFFNLGWRMDEYDAKTKFVPPDVNLFYWLSY